MRYHIVLMSETSCNILHCAGQALRSPAQYFTWSSNAVDDAARLKNTNFSRQQGSCAGSRRKKQHDQTKTVASYSLVPRECACDSDTACRSAQCKKKRIPISMTTAGLEPATFWYRWAIEAKRATIAPGSHIRVSRTETRRSLRSLESSLRQPAHYSDQLDRHIHSDLPHHSQDTLQPS